MVKNPESEPAGQPAGMCDFSAGVRRVFSRRRFGHAIRVSDMAAHGAHRHRAKHFHP
jgi:hypothetical protein